MCLRFTVTLVFSFVCLAAPAWADFQAGMEAYKRGDYATALREWRPLAEQGDAGAQFYLGIMYGKGLGVEKDDMQSRRWHEKAAGQGEVHSQFVLGGLYEQGRGVPQDYVQARQWYEKAAAQGDILSQ